jgi:hypothetical protein
VHIEGSLDTLPQVGTKYPFRLGNVIVGQRVSKNELHVAFDAIKNTRCFSVALDDETDMTTK